MFEKCPECGNYANYELIQVSVDPDSPRVCFDCLTPELQAAYRKFEDTLSPDHSPTVSTNRGEE